MKALAEGRADAAFLWAPTAGVQSATRPPTTAASRSSRSTARTSPWQADTTRRPRSLRDAVDAVLPEVLKTFPDRSPNMASRPSARSSRKPSSSRRRRSWWRRLRRPPRSPLPPNGAAVRPSKRLPGKGCRRRGTRFPNVAPLVPPATPEMIAEGKGAFNGNCAHFSRSGRGDGPTHGGPAPPNAALRGRSAQHVWKSVHEGRPAKWMPPWKGVLSRRAVRADLRFLALGPVEGVSRTAPDRLERKLQGEDRHVSVAHRVHSSARSGDRPQWRSDQLSSLATVSSAKNDRGHRLSVISRRWLSRRSRKIRTHRGAGDDHKSS